MKEQTPGIAPPVITLKNVSVGQPDKRVLDSIDLTIRLHEQWAIIGKSGSGKTTLAHVIAGTVYHTGELCIHFPAPENHQTGILLIEQQHRFRNLSNTRDFYYQQRFNSSDAANSITVAQALETYQPDHADRNKVMYWVNLLQLETLLQKPLIQLSNGENKRLQLAEALLSEPALLVLDNPFTGLDSNGRIILHTIIDSVTAAGIHVILITSVGELPESITHVAVLENGKLVRQTEKSGYRPVTMSDKALSSRFDPGLLKQMEPDPGFPFRSAIKMVNVNVRYGDKAILTGIHWEVKKGECWSVSGPNGAGKSTLLSLINADNPQAYANEIYLFDQRRGRGESIWDIKRRTGFVSPELHLFFEQHCMASDVIASGLFDTIGLFRPLNEEQKKQVDHWIHLLQLQPIRQKPLFLLSLGQQRMVLLARALVKNPPLLILDEPCQGLDEEQSAYFKSLVDQLCRHFNTTLLYVSHYEKDIPDCVTHSLRLENGKRIL